MTDRPISGPPAGPFTVPDPVLAVAAGARITPVWRNELGGLTFRLDDGRHVKWSPDGDLPAEAARLQWARPFTTVPAVLESGASDGGSWLVTATIAGRSAVDPRWLREPATAASAIGRGLRQLHDALPVDGCPFDWGVAHRLTRAGVRLSEPVPPVDRLVVCHGDACAPNTLLRDDGEVAGHVDLGALGVGDRWADLAVAAWSTEWNYGRGHTEAVYAAYGVAPDPGRIAFYRLLWDAT